MFGSGLQKQITENSHALITAVAELKNHVITCDKRTEVADRRAEALDRKLEKFDHDLDQSRKDRRADIDALEEKFDKKHSENRKFLYTIVGGIAISLVAKLLEYIQVVPTNGVHH